jgi:RecB family exonuclease
MAFDLAFGRAVHAALFRWQRAVDGGAAPAPASLALEVRRAAAEQHLPGDELERALEREMPSLEAYAAGPWPRLRTVWLEHPLHLEVRDGLFEMKVAMRLDRAVLERGGLCIIDYKTVPPHRAELERDAWQLRVYALAAAVGMPAHPVARLVLLDVRRGREVEVPAGAAGRSCSR